MNKKIKFSSNKINYKKQIYQNAVVEYDKEDIPVCLIYKDNDNDMPAIYTIAECARIFDIKENTLWVWIYRHNIGSPSRTISGNFYFKKFQLEKLCSEIRKRKIKNNIFFKMREIR